MHKILLFLLFNIVGLPVNRENKNLPLVALNLKPGLWWRWLLAFALMGGMTQLANAQTPGLIYKTAGTGASVLDPNGDGYTSPTTAGFSGTDVGSGSEIPYKALPQVGLEPTSDLGPGPNCFFTDIVDNGQETGVSMFVNAAGHFMFRFRLGGSAPNSKGYSILFDIDQRFGTTGPSADPNAVAGNPGFEFEINLATNFGVRLYNVDGTTNPTLVSTQLYENFAQKSVALTRNCGDIDVFYDFYIPLAAIQAAFPSFNLNTPFRAVGNTLIAPQSAMQLTTISDINGIVTANYGNNPVAAWTALVYNFQPTTAASIQSGGSFPTDRSQPPVVSAIASGATSITGTSTEAPGTTVNIFINGALSGTTTVQSGGTWVFSTSALASGANVYATQQASGELVSVASNIVTAGGSTCTGLPSLNNVTITCSSQKGIEGTAAGVAAGTIIRLYQITPTGVSSTPAVLPVQTNASGYFFAKCNTSLQNCNSGTNADACLTGSYLITVQEPGKCESGFASAAFCSTNRSSGTPTITSSNLTTTATTVSGTVTPTASPTTVYLLSNGIIIGSTSVTGTSTNTPFTIANLSLKAGQAITALSISTGSCASSQSTAVNIAATAPLVNSPILTSSPAITGTSIELAGTLITVYRGGTAIGTTTVDSNGNWSLSTAGIALASGDNITAAVTTPAGTRVSQISNTVVVQSQSNSIPTVTGPLAEGATAVSGTSIAPNGTIINVYEDDFIIGTAVVSGGVWTLSGLSSALNAPTLYAGGVVYATTATQGNLYEGPKSNAVTVGCPVIPSGNSITAAQTAICTGQSTSITVTGALTETIYSLLNASNGTIIGTSRLGTGGNLVFNTGPLSATTTLQVKATRLSNFLCEQVLSASPVITVNPFPNINNAVTAVSPVCAGTVTNVLVDNSQNNFTYQLRIGTNNVGAPVAGNGGTITLSAGPTPANSNITYNVLVTGVAPSSCSVQLTQTVTVREDCPAVYTITTLTSKDAFINGFVVASATDPNGAITAAAVTTGALPGGLTLGSNGTITVTNQEAIVPGGYNFTVRTTDVNGGTTLTPISLTIVAGQNAVYNVAPGRNIDSYNNGDVLATVIDQDGAIVSATLVSGILPTGVALNATTGQFTVANAAVLVAGTYNPVIRTVDVTGGVTTQTVTIVINPNREADYTVAQARNVDSYTNGNILASVTDANGPVVSATLVSGVLPAGVTLNATTGEITVANAAALVPGTYNPVIRTVDATGGITSQTVTLTINPDNEAVYTAVPARNVDNFINGQSLATVTDTDGAIVSATFVSGTLPPGATLNSTTGQITVSDAANLRPGTYTLTVRTVDAIGGVSQPSVTIVINPDREALYSVAPARNVDSYRNNDVLATVADQDGAVVSASVIGGTLPSGTAINATTGAIFVSNAAVLIPGTYTETIRTVDATGGITNQQVTITFIGDREAVYTVTPPRNIEAYSNGNILATVADADGAVTSAVLSPGSSLPAGVSLNTNGTINVSNRSLLVAGTFTFGVTTADATGGTTTQNVTLTFIADQEAVYLVEAPRNVLNYSNGQTLASVTDANGAIVTAVISSQSLPNGVAINNTTGEITVSDASALRAGSYTFSVTTIDDIGGTTTQPVELTFLRDDAAVYTLTSPRNVDSYTNNEVIGTVADPNGPITSANLASNSSLPPGVFLNTTIGVISITNAATLVPGSYPVTIRTRDATNGITTQTITLSFLPDNEAIYSVAPARNEEAYKNGDVLASITDADGAIVAARLVSGALPGGASLNPTTGVITVTNISALTAGTFTAGITTTDATGGITTQTVVITIIPGIEAVYTVAPARNVDNYTGGNVLATVTDGNGQIVSATLASGSLPSGVVLNAVTGLITVGSAPQLIAGTYTFGVFTTDETGGTTLNNVILNFILDKEASYTVAAAQNINRYANGQSLATVTDADGAITAATLISGALPAGTSLNATTGEITVTNAAVLVAGTFNPVIRTVDATGGVTTQPVTITINPDREAEYTVAQARNVDSYTNGNILVTVSDLDGAIVSAVLASGELPQGVVLNATTGAISVANATELVAGSYTFSVTTTDISGGITTRQVTIIFNADREATYAIVPGRNVDNFSTGQNLGTVADPDGAVLSAVVSDGMLPPGVALNATTGQLSVANPAVLVAGTYTFTVNTTDEDGGKSLITVTLNFVSDREGIYTTNWVNEDSSVGTILATVSDADGPITEANLLSGTLPAGTTLNATTGAITVTAEGMMQPGDYTVSIRTIDFTGGITTQRITLEVFKDTEAAYSVIRNTDPNDLTDGTVVASVTDADGAIVSAVLANGTNLPKGLMLNATTGTIEVSDQNALESGAFTFQIFTTDATGGKSVSNIVILIDGTPLPVSWLTFTAVARGNVSKLNWSTASEENNAMFVVERSADGQVFEEIGKVTGKGNSVTVSNYDFTDNRPLPGHNYYRLKQVDFDGSIDYSVIRNVRFEIPLVPVLTVYPNPADAQVKVQLTGAEGQKVEVYAMDGRLLMSQNLENSMVTLDVSKLAYGVYMVKVHSGKKVFTQKLNKVK